MKPNQTKTKIFFIKITLFGNKWPENCWYAIKQNSTNQPTNLKPYNYLQIFVYLIGILDNRV